MIFPLKFFFFSVSQTDEMLYELVVDIGSVWCMEIMDWRFDAMTALRGNVWFMYCGNN